MTRKSDTSFFVHKKVFKARSACIIKQSGSEHDYSEHLDIRYIVFPCSRFQKKLIPGIHACVELCRLKRIFFIGPFNSTCKRGTDL